MRRFVQLGLIFFAAFAFTTIANAQSNPEPLDISYFNAVSECQLRNVLHDCSCDCRRLDNLVSFCLTPNEFENLTDLGLSNIPNLGLSSIPNLDYNDYNKSCQVHPSWSMTFNDNGLNGIFLWTERVYGETNNEVTNISATILPILQPVTSNFEVYEDLEGGVVATEENQNTIDWEATLANVFLLIFLIVGIVAIAFGLYGAFKWITAQGSEEDVEEAQKIIRNAIIGVLLAGIAGILTIFLSSVAGFTEDQFSNEPDPSINEEIDDAGDSNDEFLRDIIENEFDQNN